MIVAVAIAVAQIRNLKPLLKQHQISDVAVAVVVAVEVAKNRILMPSSLRGHQVSHMAIAAAVVVAVAAISSIALLPTSQGSVKGGQ